MPEHLERLRIALAGHYTIERELGRGGNAIVYLAHDPKHGRQVALKVLLPELALSVRAERFLREIQIAAKLTHPHILPVHDSGAAEGILYYVMPYVEGESLRDRLQREPQLPLAEALQIARDVADALSYAHRHDVVHRDIKPENILLQAGHALVADFGIARALTEASGQTVTQTGIAVGTPVYMSPEQGSGSKTIDGRSDIYSLGCVLYEMLTGKPPFAGDTPQEIVAHHVLDPVPPLRKLRREVPPAVEDAILTALAKLPAERFVTADAFTAALADPEGQRSGATWRRVQRASRRTSIRVYAGVGLSVLLLGWWLAAHPLRSHAGVTATAEQSLAVLPFVNMSGDTANEYLSDGMTEELINALVQIPGLRVPARTSAFVFKGKTEDIRDIGRRLNVARLVEGSVQRAGTRLRVTAQLIDVSDGYHVWSETYDRELRDVFNMQDELVRAIAGAVQVKLAGAPALERHATDNVAAHDAYLRGRYFFYQRTATGMRKAIAYYEQAIATDSGYALAYSGLADDYMLGANFDYFPWKEASRRAKTAALRAVALDSSLAEGWISLGTALNWGEWEWREAERAFRRGIELNPHYPLGHSWYGQFVTATYFGKEHEEAGLREGALAMQLDPLSAAFTNNYGNALMGARRYPEAAAAYRKAIELRPDWFFPHFGLGSSYVGQEKYQDAVAEFESALRLNHLYLPALGFLGHAYARLGQRSAARQILTELRQRRRGLGGFWLAHAAASLGLADREGAVAGLDSAVAQRDYSVPMLKHRIWDPLRSDPRFARILARAGISP